MKILFRIIRLKETQELFLAKQYFLDSGKHTLFCRYEKDKEPEFKRWGMNNEYNQDIEIIGNYETDKINFNWENGISYKNKISLNNND